MMFQIKSSLEPEDWSDASLTIRTTHQFQAPPYAVFEALDGADAWRWLGPGCGVDYLEPANDGSARGVGMVREMGTVHDPLRWIWRQRERWVEYAAPTRMVYFAESATLPLLRLWAERYELAERTDGGTELVWTVAFTPTLVGRLPLRWLQPPLRVAFTWSIRPGLRRLIDRQVQIAE